MQRPASAPCPTTTLTKIVDGRGLARARAAEMSLRRVERGCDGSHNGHACVSRRLDSHSQSLCIVQHLAALVHMRRGVDARVTRRGCAQRQTDQKTTEETAVCTYASLRHGMPRAERASQPCQRANSIFHGTHFKCTLPRMTISLIDELARSPAARSCSTQAWRDRSAVKVATGAHGWKTECLQALRGDSQ